MRVLNNYYKFVAARWAACRGKRAVGGLHGDQNTSKYGETNVLDLDGTIVSKITCVYLGWGPSCCNQPCALDHKESP